MSIPVGKDSTSMKMSWTEPTSKEAEEVTSPLSLVVTLSQLSEIPEQNVDACSSKIFGSWRDDLTQGRLGQGKVGVASSR